MSQARAASGLVVMRVPLLSYVTNAPDSLVAGYFDVWGNYIEYQLKADARDAWLDSLGEVNNRVPGRSSPV